MTYRSTHTEVASWYGPGFAGRPTSTGETYNPEGLTAASRTLPLGSHVRVTNPDTGRSVVVRINDRGPFVHGRSLDLSHGAAQQIGLTGKGVGRVQVTPTATSTPAASWPEATYASSASSFRRATSVTFRTHRGLRPQCMYAAAVVTIRRGEWSRIRSANGSQARFLDSEYRRSQSNRAAANLCSCLPRPKIPSTKSRPTR